MQFSVISKTSFSFGEGPYSSVGEYSQCILSPVNWVVFLFEENMFFLQVSIFIFLIKFVINLKWMTFLKNFCRKFLNWWMIKEIKKLKIK